MENSLSPERYYNEQEIEALKEVFNALTNIEDKYNFFNQKFFAQYSQLGYLFPINNFEGFIIHPKNEEERKWLNYTLINEVKRSFDSVQFKAPNRRRIFEFEREIENLNAKLKEAKNWSPILEKEIKWIEAEIIWNESKADFFTPTFDFRRSHFEEQQKVFWLAGFENYHYKRNTPDYGKLNCGSRNLLAYENGYNVAVYFEYIDKKLLNIKKSRKSGELDETHLKQQLLLLDYLGFINKLSKDLNNKDRNKILAIILNRSENSIKKDLTNMVHHQKTYEIRTKKNYDFLIKLFEEMKLNDIVEEVKRDRDRLK